MKLDKKRRIEYKTDYHRRLGLLKSNSPRFVVRKTNKYVILQIIESKNAQDKVVFSANTKELLKHGWPKEKEGSLKSIPAAYLGGLLLGKKASSIKGRVILDIGLNPSTKGSKIYSAVKGLADSGIKINFDLEMAPPKEKIEGNGSKIDSKILNKIKENVSK
ncbi:MAG: 50S ribosomal protein L18 [Candidatus Pacearchaeota archaeon]|jgi:large subunit ribosomal protein L18